MGGFGECIGKPDASSRSGAAACRVVAQPKTEEVYALLCYKRERDEFGERSARARPARRRRRVRPNLDSAADIPRTYRRMSAGYRRALLGSLSRPHHEKRNTRSRSRVRIDIEIYIYIRSNIIIVTEEKEKKKYTAWSTHTRLPRSRTGRGTRGNPRAEGREMCPSGGRIVKPCLQIVVEKFQTFVILIAIARGRLETDRGVAASFLADKSVGTFRNVRYRRVRKRDIMW